MTKAHQGTEVKNGLSRRAINDGELPQCAMTILQRIINMLASQLVD
ncbi:MAG TPA: hypothetical protein PKZ97_05225 [Azospirillaceae bacterium]|nr:hypothetical protein [Azospirillaceae bacterium]HRQ80500.1 hypothetical protein [Azospirillaceae bacterium]